MERNCDLNSMGTKYHYQYHFLSKTVILTELMLILLLLHPAITLSMAEEHVIHYLYGCLSNTCKHFEI